MMNCNRKWFYILAVLLIGGLLLSGCSSNLRPTDPTPANPPSSGVEDANSVRVTYNYDDTGKVQLSSNNLTLRVGQKLILQPAAGLTKTTRFSSSGENFWGDVMAQDPSQPQTGQVIFTAIKPGKGQLQVIPNTNDTNRAAQLWVTVQ